MSYTPVPLTAVAAAAATVSCDEVQADAAGLWWLQSVPQEEGRTALMRVLNDGDVREFSPAGTDVGSRLHGYGGGAYAVGDRRVWYVDGAQGHVMALDSDAGPQLVAQRGDEEEHFGDLFADGDRLWCVRETGSGDELLTIYPDGTRRSMLRTDGFLGSPRPVDGMLAWQRWDPDRMPWDGAEVMVAALQGVDLTQVRRAAGGREESVTQPCWDADRRLWFVSDRTGFWNLYTWDGQSTVAMAPMQADVAPPEWEAGYRSFARMPGGGVAMIKYDGSQHELLVSDRSGMRPVHTAYTSFKPYLARHGKHLIAIAASSEQLPRVVAIDTEMPEVSRSLAEPRTVLPVVSQPELIRVPTTTHTEVQVLLYPPAGASTDWCAPLIVRAHPGPTSSINARLDWHVQFLASRGFAVADVDYRGSTGYGRQFRRALYNQWGTADVQDCAAVAEHLLAAGRTRAGEVFMTGASAGGYTALHAVSRPSPFTAAVARSAIVDPHTWQRTAPRWQRPHALALSGPAGPVRAESINRPVLLIHGVDDHVAPFTDVAELARRLQDRGVSCRLISLDARHSLSAEHAAARALNAEVGFYQTLLENESPRSR